MIARGVRGAREAGIFGGKGTQGKGRPPRLGKGSGVRAQALELGLWNSGIPTGKMTMMRQMTSSRNTTPKGQRPPGRADAGAGEQLIRIGRVLGWMGDGGGCRRPTGDDESLLVRCPDMLDQRAAWWEEGDGGGLRPFFC